MAITNKEYKKVTYTRCWHRDNAQKEVPRRKRTEYMRNYRMSNPKYVQKERVKNANRLKKFSVRDKFIDYCRKNESFKCGQCKEWVWNKFNDGFGVQLPLNDPNAEHKWREHNFDWLTSSENDAHIKRGDILQIDWIKGYGTLHTAIVLKRTHTDMEWLDSNWKNDEIVRIHKISNEKLLTKANKFTVYKPDYSVLNLHV